MKKIISMLLLGILGLNALGADPGIIEYPGFPVEEIIASFSISANKLGDPFVALDGGKNGHISLKRWDGKEWSPWGSATNVTENMKFDCRCNFPVLVMNACDYPTLCWVGTLSEERSEIFLGSWSGSAWGKCRKISYGNDTESAAVRCLWPDMSINEKDHIGVAWAECINLKSRFKAALFDGKSWSEIQDQADGKTPAPNPSFISVPKVALNNRDSLYIAWLEEKNVNIMDAIFLKAWEGNQWVELQGSASKYGLSEYECLNSSPEMALDGLGNPIVAWVTRSISRENVHNDANRILLKSWDGKQWLGLGGSDSGNGVYSIKDESIIDLSVSILPGDCPVVAWINERCSKILIRYWNGKQWEELNFPQLEETGRDAYFSKLRMFTNSNGEILIGCVRVSNDQREFKAFKIMLR